MLELPSQMEWFIILMNLGFMQIELAGNSVLL